MTSTRTNESLLKEKLSGQPIPLGYACLNNVLERVFAQHANMSIGTVKRVMLNMVNEGGAVPPSGQRDVCGNAVLQPSVTPLLSLS